MSPRQGGADRRGEPRLQGAPLPGNNPGLVLVEALPRRLRENVANRHCRAAADAPTRRVAAFKSHVNQEPCAAACIRAKHRLGPRSSRLPER